MKNRKILIVISFILFIRVLISIFVSDILYSNTNNLIESMLLDLSPYLIYGTGFLIYYFIIRKYDIIVSKYTNRSIASILIIPIIFITIIFTLYNKNLIIDSYDENLAMTMPAYLPSLVRELDNVFNWLKGKTFLGNCIYFYGWMLNILILLNV